MISPEGPIEVHMIHATPEGHRLFTGHLEDWSSVGLTVRSAGEGAVFFPWVNVHHVREWRAEPAVPRGSSFTRDDGSIDWDRAQLKIDRASGWS